MKFIIAKDYEEMSKLGADCIIDQIKKKSDSILGFATGSTPEGTYRYLIDAYKKGLDFSKIISFNLDEYYGLSPEHPESYMYFMEKNLFKHVNIDRSKIHIPNGLCKDIEKECTEYDASIRNAGFIDLQLLGIGRNGHIGFNEPGDSLNIATHVTDLTESTIEANSRFFNSIDEVPKKALTMGMGTIMKSKKILLMASGKNKAEAIAFLAGTSVTTKVPATLLLLHRDVTVIADRDAASLIDRRKIASL